MYKVILGQYHNDSTKAAGTIELKIKREGEGSDIITGWLYFKDGMKTQVELFFPQRVGAALFDYTGGTLEYKKISLLKDRLSL